MLFLTFISVFTDDNSSLTNVVADVSCVRKIDFCDNNETRNSCQSDRSIICQTHANTRPIGPIQTPQRNIIASPDMKVQGLVTCKSPNGDATPSGLPFFQPDSLAGTPIQDVHVNGHMLSPIVPHIPSLSSHTDIVHTPERLCQGNGHIPSPALHNISNEHITPSSGDSTSMAPALDPNVRAFVVPIVQNKEKRPSPRERNQAVSKLPTG